jgi:hypothetical protein
MASGSFPLPLPMLLKKKKARRIAPPGFSVSFKPYRF